MTATEIIRKAVDCGYSIVLTDDGPRFRGKSPVPEQLVDLARKHKPEIVDELTRRRDEGEIPPKERIDSKGLQLWVIALLKSGRCGIVMLDGVPVGVRDEAEALLAAEEAWEHHRNHRSWTQKAMKLREALEWPFEEEEKS